MKKITKILISLIMCMTLVLPALNDAIVSQAATTETVYEEYTNVSDYRGETKTHPTKAGYLFAGWYKKAGDSYQPMDAVDADAASSAYAKFVDANVLATKCQLQIGTTASSSTANMRVLTSVDSLYYDAIKFDIEIGGTPVEYTSTTAYESIIGNVDGTEVTYKANEVFASSSKYFVTFVLQNIPTSEFAAPIKLVSEWTTLDGTVVGGASRSITINNEVPDWNAGIDFEKSMDFTAIAGQGAWNDFAVSRVNYASAGIPALGDGGSYVMKMTNSNSLWPAFQFNIGKTLEAGTKITFMVYGQAVGNDYSKCKFGFHGTSGNSDVGEVFSLNEWSVVTIELPEAVSTVKMFWNLGIAVQDENNSTITSCELYIDNIFIETETDADITKGLGFGNAAQKALFTGAGVDGRDATIQRTTYGALGIAAPENGGTYALKLSHASNYWPTFRINFGKELAAGTEITFQAYGKIFGESNYNQSIFEYLAGGEATAQFMCDEWTELTITLASACSYVDLFWNIDRASITSGSASGAIYIDNMIAVEPVNVDILQGISFEHSEHESFVTGDSLQEWRTFATERVTYADAGISAPEDGNSYAMKLTQSGNLWPAFKLNFGKTLPAGSKISFKVYGKVTGTYTLNRSKFEFHTSASGDAGAEFGFEEWNTITFELPSEASSIQLCWNVGWATGDAETISATELYIDDLVAVEPLVVDILEGIDFEYSEHESFVTGDSSQEWRTFATERVTYADAGISAPENCDNYTMRLTRGDEKLWPAFKLNFGKTLPAGTQISFQAYGKIIGFTGTPVKPNTKFEIHAGDNKGVSSTEFGYDDEWHTVTLVLAAEASSVQLCWNAAWYTGDEATISSTEVYIDNMIAVEPIEVDLEKGIDFEHVEHETVVVGRGASNDAVIERVSYADLDIDTLANGGTYALKLSHESNLYPNFKINLGKEYAAGTHITFMAYAKVNGTPTDDRTKFEFVGSSGSGDAGKDLRLNKWTVYTIEIQSATDVVELFWNVNWSGIQDNEGNGELYIDNMMIEQTITVDVSQGIDFEHFMHSDVLSGQNKSGSEWQDGTFERISYAAEGLVAPENGKDYVLKIGASGQWNFYYPKFQINLGKVYEAGTTITFMAYGHIDGDSTYNKSVFEFDGSGGSGDATKEFSCDQWTECTITLTEATDTVKLFWNYDRAQGLVDGTSGEVYIDNLYVVEP